MSVPFLCSPLVALVTDTWVESFEFYLGGVSVADALPLTSRFELVMRLRDTATPATVLSTEDGRLFIDGNKMGVQMPQADVQALGAGLFEFQILEHRDDGVVRTRLLGNVEFRVGV